MGILNVTPDSFSDGGNFNSVGQALNHAILMVKEGADIIDVGGESTRPGSDEVESKEEIKRVVPVIHELKRFINKPISIDTYKASVAEAALEAGANVVNDVWGLQRDPEIASVVAKYNVPVIVMHNKYNTEYDSDIMDTMIEFFKKSIAIAHEAGIKNEMIILDPGIGFGKTVDQNLEVMRRLDELQVLGYPLLLGISRKSIIGNTIDAPTHDRLEGTIALNAIGIQMGVEIIRVHDIKENVKAAKMIDAVVRGTYEKR
ncbi:MAG: dihydropteroate synthase [Clostridiales bacterium]|nr:dihydropteroate synthase [Clostridiales bacterium]